MTKEELEKDYYADRPTEPCFDDDKPNDWANLAHYAEENLEKAFKQIADLEAENKEMTLKIDRLESYCDAYNYSQRTYQEEIKELKAEIEKMKCCENCKHHCFWGNELNCRTLSYDEELECMKTKNKWELEE